MSTSEEREAHYRSAVRGRFERLELQGLTPDSPARGPRLEDVYVALQAVAEVPEGLDDASAPERRLLHAQAREGHSGVEQERELDGLRYRRWMQEARRERPHSPPRSVEFLVEELPHPALVLLGDPGSGKSTLLRYLALRATSSERLPIFVPLAAYDECLRQASLPLEEFLSVYPAKWQGLPGLGPLFRAALEGGRALVLLDGLDEVLTVETRRRVAEQVQTLVKRWGEGGNRFVLTSRFIGYREVQLPADVPHYMVVDFGPEEVERFVRQWYGALEPEAAQPRARRLLEQLQARPALAHLTTHPLLLTMLTLMHEQAPLPTRRIDLYGRYVDLLVDGWRRPRGAGADEVHARLMDLALWLHLHRPSGTATQADLVRALGGRTPPWDLAGLVGERGRDAYGFLHLTFQEYFVGRALARLSPEARWELLRPHVQDPRWHEPLLLCAAWLATVEGAPEQAEALVEAILARGSECESVLHRDLFLAVAVLEEEVVLSERLCDRLLGQFEALKSSPVPPIRRRALEGVVHLMRLGHAPAAQRLQVWLDARQERTSRRRILAAFRQVLSGAVPEALYGTLPGLLGDELLEDEVHSWLMNAGARDEGLRQALCALLETGEVHVRKAVVGLLAHWVDRDARVGQALLGRLADEDEHLRALIAQTLSPLVPGDARVRRAVLDRLALETSPLVRSRLANTLGAVEGTEDAVLHTLLGLDEDFEAPDSRVWDALGACAERDARVKHALLRHLGGRHEMTRSAACRGLKTLVGRHEDVRQAILVCLGDTSARVRRITCGVLDSWAVGDARVRQALLACLEDEEPDVRSEALEALIEAAVGDEPVARALLARLGDEDSSVRWMADAVLRPLATEASEGRRALLAHLTHEDPGQRAAAVKLLGESARSEVPVRQALLGLLRDEDEDVRAAVVQALKDQLSSEVLLNLLNDKAGRVKQAAVVGLRPRVGGDAHVRRVLLSRIDDPHAGMGNAIAHALRTMADRDEPIRQALMGRLDEELSSWREWEAHEAVARALGVAARSDGQVRQRLRDFLDDEDAQVRQLAARALEERETWSDPPGAEDERTARLQALAEELGARVDQDAQVRRSFLARLEVEPYFTRVRIVEAFALSHCDDPAVEAALVPWLGSVSPPHFAAEDRQVVARYLGPRVGRDARLRERLVSMLRHPQAETRQGAAMALTFMPEERLVPAQLILTALLEDPRDAARWRKRLSLSQALLNVRDRQTSERAIACALQALEHGFPLWFDEYYAGQQRARAAAILGELEPVYRDERVLERLLRLMREDTNGEVRGAAHQAVLRLLVAPVEPTARG